MNRVSRGLVAVSTPKEILEVRKRFRRHRFFDGPICSVHFPARVVSTLSVGMWGMALMEVALIE
jgi:hypothetical protein